MKSEAAILPGVGHDWEVCEIDLDQPRANEVLVRMRVAGVCHSDDHFATGDAVPPPEMADMMRSLGIAAPEYFPLIGGHEGAGVVEAVGPNVTGLQRGDHVGMSFIPAFMLSLCRSVEIESGRKPCWIAGAAWRKMKLPPPWPTSKIMPRFFASNR